MKNIHRALLFSIIPVLASLAPAAEKAPAAEEGKAADNTGRNKKDGEDKSVTPPEQGNSDADIKITKDIRSAVVGSNLSFNAKNIKIITKDGKVFLRGVVESKDEHMAIQKIAYGIVAKENITDEITTKAN